MTNNFTFNLKPVNDAGEYLVDGTCNGTPPSPPLNAISVSGSTVTAKIKKPGQGVPYCFFVNPAEPTEPAVIIYGIDTGEIAAYYTNTTIVFGWPADLSEYRLFFVSREVRSPTSGQLAVLMEFLQNGGRLVVIGEYYPFLTDTYRNILNGILSDLGVGIQFNRDRFDDWCLWAGDTNADQVTSGLSTIGYAATCTLTGGKWLAKTVTHAEGDDQGGHPFMAVGQPPGMPDRPMHDVVVIGDSNVLCGCEEYDRTTLVANLLG